jgi:thymidine phosphorylase
MAALSLGINEGEARVRAEEALRSGAAFNKMREWVAAQGGDVKYVDNPELFPAPTQKKQILAERDGFIISMNAEEIGLAAVMLGAGRKTKDDGIDFTAGINLFSKPGDRIKAGEPIAELYTTAGEISEAVEILNSAVLFSDEPIAEEKPLIIDEIYRR